MQPVAQPQDPQAVIHAMTQGQWAQVMRLVQAARSAAAEAAHGLRSAHAQAHSTAQQLSGNGHPQQIQGTAQTGCISPGEKAVSDEQQSTAPCTANTQQSVQVVQADCPGTGQQGSPGSTGARGQFARWGSTRAALQAWVIAGLHVYGKCGRWAQALQLGAPESAAQAAAGTSKQAHARDDSEPPQLTPREVRRAYRRVALLIHPDKCSLPGAQHAFQLAGSACAHLLGDDGDDPGSVPVAKRRRRGGHDDQQGGSGFGDGGDGREDGASDWEEAEEEEEGYNWWDAWEVPVGRTQPPLHVQHMEKASKERQEEPELWRMGLQELRQVVAERQAHLLTPRTPEDAALDLHTRQIRLRYARGVLSSRIAGHPCPPHLTKPEDHQETPAQPNSGSPPADRHEHSRPGAPPVTAALPAGDGQGNSAPQRVSGDAGAEAGEANCAGVQEDHLAGGFLRPDL